MAILAVEFLITVVGNFNRLILDLKRVGEILSQCMSRDLGSPAVEILSIKKPHPRMPDFLGVDRLRQSGQNDADYRKSKGFEHDSAA